MTSSSAQVAGLSGALQQDIQAVETAATAGEMSSAVDRLATDLSKAMTAGSSGNAPIDAELRQATTELSQAVTALQATGKGTPSAAPSPLQNPVGSTNSVKDVIDELNTAYDLLEKIVMDSAAIARALGGTPAPTTTAAPGLYVLSIINTNPAFGTVNALDINCGGSEQQCTASESVDSIVGITFQGAVLNGVQYDVAGIQSSPPGCRYGQKLPASSAGCPLQANTNTTVTVIWAPQQ